MSAGFDPLRWLRLLVLIAAVPAWAATAWILVDSYGQQRETLIGGTTGTTRALMRAVGGELGSAQAALQVLTHSFYLAEGDLAGFHTQARRVLERQRGSAIALADSAGQQVMNTAVPWGSELPKSAAAELIRRIVAIGEPAVGDYYVGAISKRGQVAVGVPVFRDGSVAYVLTMALLPERLGSVLGVDTLPRGSVAALIDRGGTVVARTRAAEQFVGRPAPPALLERLRESSEGVLETTSLEGTPVLVSYSRSSASGWTVAIGIPAAEITAPLHRALWLSAAVAALIFLIALFVPRLLTLRIERSIRATVTAMTEKLREQDAGMRRAHEMARLGHIVTGPQGVFESWSDTLPGLVGMAPGNVPQSTREWLAFVHPEDRESFRAAVIQTARAGGRCDLEYRLLRSDGTAMHVRQSVEPLEGDGGGRWFSTLQDITERRQAEDEIRSLNETLERRIAERTAELARANAMKSEFLATMSHELRTPLNAIIGFSEVLKDGLAGRLTPEQANFVHDIHASGRHLLALINDILDLSKVEAGMMALEPEPVDLATLLQGSVAVLKERATRGRVALGVEVEPGLPAFSGDARRVKQIVYNLVANAVKFTPAGGQVRIAARRVPRARVALRAGCPGRMAAAPAADAPEFIEIEVADTGIGIAEGDLASLFQPFVQLEGALARRHEGTGLGLAMVLRLAELHGGSAGVESAPGAGTSFFVWLPFVPAQPRAQSALAAAPSEPAPRGESIALVVEDDDSAAKLLERVLAAEGFRCRRAATGEEALARAAKERPDLITLDIFLPGMDGWQVLERLKADARLADVPVVLVTVESGLERGLVLGARRVLQKPFSRAEVEAALAGIVPPREGARCTALVVDDNPKAVELLAGYLSTEFRVLRAYGGREAIEVIGRERPDVALLDLVMPEVSGFDVIERARRDPRTASMPIIVVTAKDLSAEERAYLNGSVSRVVEKAGLGWKDLVDEVRRAVGRTAAEV